MSAAKNQKELLSSAVIIALMENDVDRLKQLREVGEQFNYCDEEGNSLLHLAIMHERQNPRTEASRGCHLNRIEAFDYLLTLSEVDKNFWNAHWSTPLEEICLHLRDSPEWAIKLINSGCTIKHVFSDDNSALHWAVYNDWYEVAELLIERGIGIDVINGNGATALYSACKLGRVDFIWMLLFYGADPNEPEAGFVGNCFDLAIRGLVTQEVQEIFLGMSLGFERCFNIITFVEAMERSSPDMFHNLCEISDDIAYDPDGFAGFLRLNPRLFKLFIGKFSSAGLEMLKYRLEYLVPAVRDKNGLETLSANIFTLMESDIGDHVVTMFNNYEGLVPFVISFIQAFKGHEDELTKQLFHMLNYGVKITAEIMDEIYDLFGYGSLFKMLLYMDIEEMNYYSKNSDFFPEIYYDLELIPEGFIGHIEAPICRCKKLTSLFDYFALPKLVDCCTGHVESCGDHSTESDEELVEFSGLSDRTRFRERVQRLPTVPKLQELARNEAREYIISRYEIEKCGQFYTIVNWLPIAKVYKEILCYERKLYD